MTQRTAGRLKTLRLASQVLFAAAFVATCLASLDPFARVDNLFLRSDPLIFLTHLTLQPVALALMAAVGAAALLVGRVFCGWVCPLGSLIDLLDLAASPLRRLLRARLRRSTGGPRPVALATDLPPSVFLLGLLLPAIFVAPPVLQALHPNVWAVRIVSLSAPGLAFAGLLLAAGLAGRRLWCRFACPLGALYGLAGRVAPFRLRIDRCSACGRCDRCPMGAADAAGGRILSHQCTLCFDYEQACPTQGFRFGLRRVAEVDAGRRRFLLQAAGLAAGAAAAAALGSARRPVATPLLRPPGVTDEGRFVERCLRCLQCARSCPNGIIKATGARAGFASLLTPHLEFGEYGCDYRCQVCQTVCPNFAIPLQTLAQKQLTPIGKARISEQDCVVFRDSINCLVCEEVCPVPGKAIAVREGAGTKDGKALVLRFPVMRDELCIGCGICEAGCPATPLAIRVART